MSEQATKRLPKPNLRDLNSIQSRRNLFTAVGLCIIVGGIFYYRNMDRKRDYAEFYKNYDATASFERMKDAGLMESCKPKEE